MASPQFADIIRQSLRITHEQLILTLTGAEGAAITIGPGGTISLSLGPILAQVKTTLQDAGVGIANLIPETDRMIPIATVAQIEQIATAYQVAVVVGTWLPWLVILMFAAAVVLARRRSTMLFAAGIVFAGVAGVLGIAIAFGRVISTSALAQYIPISAGGPIYDGLVSTTVDLVVVLVVLGLSVALVAFLAAPWRPSRAIRRFGDASADSLANFAASHGVSTGGFGDFLRQWRIAIRIGIGVIAAAIIIFVRPLSPALIIWTLVIALLLVVLARLLERPATRPRPPRRSDRRRSGSLRLGGTSGLMASRLPGRSMPRLRGPALAGLVVASALLLTGCLPLPFRARPEPQFGTRGRLRRARAVLPPDHRLDRVRRPDRLRRGDRSARLGRPVR